VLTIKVLFAQPGLPIGEQGSRGRAQLLGTSFAQYERAFREQMGDMFAPGGVDPRRDLAGIILKGSDRLTIPVIGCTFLRHGEH
jgi:spermidine dehydrogenase